MMNHEKVLNTRLLIKKYFLFFFLISFLIQIINKNLQTNLTNYFKTIKCLLKYFPFISKKLNQMRK